MILPSYASLEASRRRGNARSAANAGRKPGGRLGGSANYDGTNGRNKAKLKTESLARGAAALEAAMKKP